MLSCISSTLLHHHLLSLLIIYVEMPCPSIINTYSICHHTMFFHSNIVLVHQTSKRKRVIAEPEGAPAKSLKNVVVPEKSDNTPLILAVQLVTQNVGPTLADCTHTSLATLIRLRRIYNFLLFHANILQLSYTFGNFLYYFWD